MKDDFVKIYKRKPHLEWSWEANRGALMPYHSSIADPIGKDHLTLETTTPTGRRAFLLPHPAPPAHPATAQPIRGSHSSANEKPLHSILPTPLFAQLVYDFAIGGRPVLHFSALPE